MPKLNIETLVSQLIKCETNISWCYEQSVNNEITERLDKERIRLMAIIKSLETLLEGD